MKNCKAVIYSLLSVLAATTASAALNSAITVPWEGDVTKFHTAVAGQQIILKGVLESTAALPTLGTPDSLTFEMTDCIYYSYNAIGTYTFLVNGVTVGTDVESNALATCSPGVHRITVTGSALSTAWNAASPPAIEVIYSGGYYISEVDSILDFSGVTLTNHVFVSPNHNPANVGYICNGYSGAAFDITNIFLTPTSVSYQWNPGDGSPFSALTTVNVAPGQRFPASLNYTYSGSAGTPYVAWLIASDGVTTISNRYLVMLQPAGLDANINIAIDNGLWHQYQLGNYSDGMTSPYFTFNSQPCMAWQTINNYVTAHWSSATASTVHAFEINGSKETGDFTKDPYAEAVHLGLNWLFNGFVYSATYPMLTPYNIATQHGTDNPDSNSNGIGVSVLDYYANYDQRPTYEGGMVMDAIIASGTPNASTGRIFVGSHVATYGDVIQDMCDMYADGQADCDSSFTVITPNPDRIFYNPSNGVPQSLTFTMLDFTSSPSGTYNFYLNGQLVDTSTVQTIYSCTPGTHTVSVSGADLASAWNAATPPIIEMTYSGGYYVSWVTWTLDYGGGNVQSNALYLAPGEPAGSTYACSGYTGDALDVSQNLSDSFPQPPTQTTESGILGGWIYHWDDCYGDNSASQWAAIGMLAAQQAPFNATVPQWVKNYDDNWLWYSYYDDPNGKWGGFGYRSPAEGQATSPSGLVQMNFNGQNTSEYRWSKVERWLDDNFASWLSTAQGNLYSMYAFTKSQRTALPNPIVTFPNSGLDWYRGSATQAGVAKVLSDQLVANSYYNDNTWGGNLGTPWAVIMLKPNLFSAGPTACFSANPNPGFANLPITFDPTCSTDPQPGGIANLTLFDWSWGDGTPDTVTTSPTIVQHSFACATLPCGYQVTLTVYDNSNPVLNSSAQQTINITQPPHPPVAVIGGPYIVSLCPSDSLILNGSGSYTPDQGLSEANCNTCPPDQLTAYGWALKGAPYIYTDSTDTNADLGSGFTTYFPTADTYNIGLQVTDNAALSFPTAAPDDLSSTTFGSVTVYNAGPCDVTATPGCESVAVTWNDTGADSYNVLSSITGPNSGFNSAATAGVGVTSANIGATLNEVQWIRVQATTGNNTTMSGAIKVTNTFEDCVCINTLSIQSKATIVELQWPLVQGATSYNIYRSKGTANFPMTPQNRIATHVGTNGRGVYVDGNLINGSTYYYKISSVVGEIEQCRSMEVSAVPKATVR